MTKTYPFTTHFRIFSGAACLSFATLLSAHAGIVVSDSNFTNYGTNYTETHFNTGNGGTQTPVSQATGGNPGSYLNIANSIAAAPSGTTQSITDIFMLQNGASYTPSSQGAITTIDFSINLIKLAGTAGLIVNASPAVRQNGLYYFWPTGLQTGSTTWVTLSKTGLVASDFKQAVNDPSGVSYFSNTSPNFTSGSTIDFGLAYPTGGSSGGAAFTTQAGFDNWITTANTVPEPSTWLVMIAGGIPLLFGRRHGSKLLSKLKA